MTTTVPSLVPVTEHAAPAGLAARLSSEAARYLAASIAALALDAGLLWILSGTFAMPVWLGGGLAYLAGLVLVYVLSVRWVFRTRAMGNTRMEFIAFAALGAFGLMLNSITLSVATACGLALPIAKAVSAGIGFVANFVSRKALLFTRR